MGQKDSVLEDTKRRIHCLMNSLFGKMLVHKSMEEKVLFVEVLKVRDNDLLLRKAQELMRETTLVKERVIAYRESLIQRERIDVSKFAQETSFLLNSLKTCISREEEELYPLFCQYRENKRLLSALERV